MPLIQPEDKHTASRRDPPLEDLEARYINACAQVEQLVEENRILRGAIADAQRALHSARGSITGGIFALDEVS